MTDDTARVLTGVAVGIVGVAAAYVVVTTPPLRRFALRAARVWLETSVPLVLVRQIRQAWMQPGRAA